MNQTPAGKAFVALNNFLDGKFSKKIGLRGFLEKSINKVSYVAAKTTSKKSRNFSPADKNTKAERMKSNKNSDLFDLSYTDEQKMVQQTIQEFVDRYIWSNAEKISESGSISHEILTEFDKLGLHYYAIPEKFGGFISDKSTITQMIIAEELAKGDFGVAYALLTPIGVLNAIVNFGTGEQQEKFVKSFLDEENKLFASIAVNEPNSLFDPYKLSTKALSKGDKYILNGVKSAIPLGEKSEIFLVAAELDDKGPQVFIVESGIDGIKIQKQPSMGLNPAELTNVYFNNVEISKEALLGGGIDYQEFINNIRVAWCSMAVGTCNKCLDYVIEYCNNRVAFGEPITHRQSVAFMIANIKIELEGMRMLTQRAASRIEHGLDAKKESYLASIFCNEHSMKIASDGVQLLGGHGFIRDYPVERWYRDLRALAISYNGVHI